MKRPVLIALLALAVPAATAAQGRASATPTEKDMAAASAARQTTPDAVLVSLPLVCVDSQAAGRSWADSLRLYRVPIAADAATPPNLFGQVLVTADTRFDGDCFSSVILTATAGDLDPKAEYRVLVGRFEARNVIVKPGVLTVALRKLTLEFDRRNPSHLVVVTPVRFRPGAGAADPSTIRVTRTEDGATVPFEVINQELIGAAPGPFRLRLVVDPPVRTGMKVAVTAVDASGQGITGSGKVKFAAPENKKESEFYVEIAAEAGEGQKPNVLFDLKVDRSKAVELPGRWTLGVELTAEAATRDAAETEKLALAYPFTHTHVYALVDRGVGALYTRFTPRIEADDIFASRNVLADLSVEVVALSLHDVFDKRASEEEKEYLWRYSVIPRLGYQWGENQRLEDEDLRDFEGYSVSRGAVEIELSLKRKLRSLGNARSLSLSVTYSGWYRFSRELDTFTDAEGESAVRLDDGYVGYLTTTLDLGLTEALGLVLKYQTGERPVLFKDEDKATLGISYRL